MTQRRERRREDATGRLHRVVSENVGFDGVPSLVHTSWWLREPVANFRESWSTEQLLVEQRYCDKLDLLVKWSDDGGLQWIYWCGELYYSPRCGRISAGQHRIS